MSIKLARKDNHQVFVELNGRRQAFSITSSTEGGGVAGSAVGNLVAGGIIGFGIDAATGAMDELTPSSVYAEFGGGTYTTTNFTRHEPPPVIPRRSEPDRTAPPPPVTTSYTRDSSSWITGKGG